MTESVQTVSGAQIVPWLDALADLRMRVFRDWPYLYDGDIDYERRYLAAYAGSPGSVFVLALDGERVVGVSSGIPLADDDAQFRAPFIARGIDPARVYYFGESVLLPAYRGRGLGHAFFDAREAHARSLGGFDLTAFCSVDRDADDPRRPPGARSNDAFWIKRGYLRQPGMQCTLDWREVGAAAESTHTLTFWLHELRPTGDNAAQG